MRLEYEPSSEPLQLLCKLHQWKRLTLPEPDFVTAVRAQTLTETPATTPNATCRTTPTFQIRGSKETHLGSVKLGPLVVDLFQQLHQYLHDCRTFVIAR